MKTEISLEDAGHLGTFRVFRSALSGMVYEADPEEAK